MTLEPHTRLGGYEIVALLGTGGMGQVYRALDPRLGREVAIKVLPAEFSADPDRLARFRREAQILASLNHSNIAQIYGLEETPGAPCLVLELVEGETLADWLQRGPIPVDEALAIAKQIVEGLEAAHERGIVHRDLKPANIKLTADGKVKLLDFGLAKGMEASPDAAESPTLMTGASVILGTAAYMSPEQARGKRLDRRTDIWAFGCVLYEMLTGEQAFSGDTVSDAIARILERDVDWQALPDSTPRAVRALLQKCFQKDANRRLKDIGDARFDLEDTSSDPIAVTAGARPRMKFLVAALATGFAALLIVTLVLWLRKTEPEGMAWNGVMLGGPAVAMQPRVSPDGKTVAFQAMIDNATQVAVINPVSGNWTVLTHDRSRGVVVYLSWSPDGTKIYFDRIDDIGVGVFSVPALGGDERLVLEAAGQPEALADGSIILTRINAKREQQYYRFWPATGKVEPLNGLSQGGFFGGSRLLPGRNELLFYGAPANETSSSQPQLLALDLKTDRIRPIPIPGAMSTFAIDPRNGRILVAARSGDLTQLVSVAPDGSGQPRTLLAVMDTITPLFDVAADGTFYVTQMPTPLEALRFSEAGGAPEVVAAVSRGPSLVGLTPTMDGRILIPSSFSGRKRVVVAKSGKDPTALVDTEEETRGPATLAGPDQAAFVLGSAEAPTIAIVSTADGRIVRRLQGAAGTGFIDSLAASPDGSTLFYSASGSIWALPSTDGQARKVTAGDAVAFDPVKGGLIVQLNEKDGVHLVRVPVTGGAAVPIPYNSSLRMPTNVLLASNAVRKDGRIVVSISPKASWYYGIAILDPNTGELRTIPTPYAGDIHHPGWDNEGRIVATGYPLRSAIWRFK